ncbi:hypothetical protein L218DRAFT_956887 [Marasmius fiardii PR-910]|nr:hypothetical protein L218DRAFT_956887 [Marasmius fiardii PR-910]
MKHFFWLAIFSLAFSTVDAIPITLLGRMYNVANLKPPAGSSFEHKPGSRSGRVKRFEIRMQKSIATDTSRHLEANLVPRDLPPQEWPSHSGPAPPSPPPLPSAPILSSGTPTVTSVPQNAPAVIHNQALKKTRGSQARVKSMPGKEGDQGKRRGHSGSAAGH